MITLPQTTFTIILTLVVGVVVLGCILNGHRTFRLVALALVVAWLSARAIPSNQDTLPVVLGWTASAGLAALTLTPGGWAVATIYSWRIALLFLERMGLISWFWMWEAQYVLLFMQLIVVTAGLIDGPSGGNSVRGALQPSHRPRRAVHSLGLSALWYRADGGVPPR